MPTSTAVIGTQQSPIDIKTADSIYSPFPSSSLDIQYRNLADISGEFTDHNFVIAPKHQPALLFRNKTYRLVKIHFHRSCEHLVDGLPPSAFELHLVHQLELSPGTAKTLPALSAEKLVVAAFFSLIPKAAKGKKREGFKLLATQLQKQRSMAASASLAGLACKRIPLKDFVPDDLSQWFFYEGSLTAEPFTEDVTWILIRMPESVPAEDVQEFIENHADQEQRATQFPNRRFVLRNFELSESKDSASKRRSHS